MCIYINSLYLLNLLRLYINYFFINFLSLIKIFNKNYLNDVNE